MLIHFYGFRTKNSSGHRMCVSRLYKSTLLIILLKCQNCPVQINFAKLGTDTSSQPKQPRPSGNLFALSKYDLVAHENSIIICQIILSRNVRG